MLVPFFRYSDLHLVALPSAVTCARLFVQFTLPLWGLRHRTAKVEAIAVQLVGNAVEATGIPGADQASAHWLQGRVLHPGPLRESGMGRSARVE